MVQASEKWVYDRLGNYKTVEVITEYVSPEIGEILLRGKTGDIFSLLLGKTDIEDLVTQLHAILQQMSH